MNELKPEDVMMALECCNTKGNCNQCPYEIVGEYTPCYSALTQDALALLREKDAEIKALVDGWSKDQDRFEKVCAEKDAEIERLEEIADAVADSFPVCEGCEGKTEFGERTEHCLYEIDNTFCAQRAMKMWFALRAENEELRKDFLDYQADVQMEIADARAEAITEFAERAKRRLPIVSPSVFDKIAQEMKEGNGNG